MLPKQILIKSNSLQATKANKVFGKYAAKKPMLSKNNKFVENESDCNDKENQQNWGNISHQLVDMNKKIRKRSPKKCMYTALAKNKQDKFNGFTVFKEDQLDMDPQLMRLTKPQRIDNDVDTDEEQVQTGLEKMMGFLKQACLERMYQNCQGMDFQ